MTKEQIVALLMQTMATDIERAKEDGIDLEKCPDYGEHGDIYGEGWDQGHYAGRISLLKYLIHRIG